MVQIVGRGFVLGPRQFVLGIPMSSRFLVLGVGMRMKTLVFIVGVLEISEIMVHFTVLVILIASPYQQGDCYAFKP